MNSSQRVEEKFGKRVLSVCEIMIQDGGYVLPFEKISEELDNKRLLPAIFKDLLNKTIIILCLSYFTVMRADC